MSSQYILFWTRQDKPNDINQKVYNIIKSNSPLNQYISTVCYDDMKKNGDKLPPGVLYLPSIVIFNKNKISNIIEPSKIFEFIKYFNSKLTTTSDNSIPLDRRAMNVMKKNNFESDLSQKTDEASYQIENVTSINNGSALFGPLPDQNESINDFINNISMDAKGNLINKFDKLNK